MGHFSPERPVPEIPLTVAAAAEYFTCPTLDCHQPGRLCARRFEAAMEFEAQELLRRLRNKPGKRIFAVRLDNPNASCVDCTAGERRSELLPRPETVPPRPAAQAEAIDLPIPPKRPTKGVQRSATLEQAIILALQHHGALPRRALATLFAKSDTYMKVKLQRMRDRGLIVVVGKGRASKAQVRVLDSESSTGT